MRKRRAQKPRWLVAEICLAVLILLVAVLAIGYHLDLKAAAKSGAAQNFEIKSGENAQLVATHLKAAKLIRDRNAFITYLNLHGLRGKLKAGTYSIAPTKTAPVIAGIITSGSSLANQLVVPEGYRLSQIEDLAARHGIAKADFIAALNSPHTNDFLAGKPTGVDLEGYLFPDSYDVTSDTTAAQLVNDMLADFGKRVGTEYTQAFAAEGLTLHQGLTLASIVEREVSNPDDRPIVAQIFLKRLKTGMPFGSDVTVQYAADQLGVPFSTTLNSPYNTYANAGLPPGPICNPGLSALDAAAHPASTDYLYFLAGKDGKTYYATTYAQHQANIAKYLN